LKPDFIERNRRRRKHFPVGWLAGSISLPE